MIYTFYSYKGGVGRTMALANIAELCYQAGLKVLMVDFDLEAPGLERFFFADDKGVENIKSHPGMMDMLLDYKGKMTDPLTEKESESVQGGNSLSFPLEGMKEHYCVRIDSRLSGELWLLPAGVRQGSNDINYPQSVLTFNWQDFYDNWEGERFFEWFRGQCLEMADVVLIDSRTGVTEMGGISTYQLADAVILFTVASEQSLEGTSQMVESLRNQKVEELRGRPIKLLVIPSRVDDSERENINKFYPRFLKQFGSLSEFLRIDLWELRVPYLSAYAFEEKVAVKINQPGDKKLVDAYDRCLRALADMAPTDSPIHRKLSKGSSFVKGFKYDVFLSYFGDQAEIATAIADALRNAGIRVWFDRWFAKSGKNIKSETSQSLIESHIVLFFTSQHWAEEEWERVKITLTPFQTVIPIRCDETSLPAELSAQPQVIDIRNRNPGQLPFDYKVAQLVSLIDPSKKPPGRFDEFSKSRSPSQNDMKYSPTQKVFISYSWDSDAHRQWVRELATRLRRDGVEVILDQWREKPGDSLTEFMERAVRESNFVLCICTPRYKQKSDSRNGGAGYEGYIMTAEFFQNHYAGKFIPVLRNGEWAESAPSWLLGLVYADLRGDTPYSGNNWEELLYKLKNNQQDVLLAGQDQPQAANIQEGDFEFVDREVELEMLAPPKLQNSYWQCALISAPAGYGKSRLLTRLIEKIRENSESYAQWNWRYIDMAKCGAPNKAIGYFWEQICERPFLNSYDEATSRKQVCDHILENLNVHPASGSSCGVLLLIDSVDDLTPASEQWLFSVFNGAVTGSYIDYDKGRTSFPVRLVLAGRQVEAFWTRYKRWENSSGCKYHLRSENLLPLSPFKKTHVEELIDSKAHRSGISTAQLEIADIAEKLLYLSGGHPSVINGILDELVIRRFRQLDDYLGDNFQRLIGNHISGVVMEIFKKYAPPVQKDVKTILVFRMVTLDILERLRSSGLISWEGDNARLLGFLRDNQFLHFDDRLLCYHDDILRRIIYLDFAFATPENRAHIQAIHQCAMEYYKTLICKKDGQKSGYFIEWLFHALQVDGIAKDEITRQWKSLLSAIRPAPVLPEDLKKAIEDGLQKDAEIRFVYRQRFGAEDFSLLFKN